MNADKRIYLRTIALLTLAAFILTPLETAFLTGPCYASSFLRTPATRKTEVSRNIAGELAGDPDERIKERLSKDTHIEYVWDETQGKYLAYEVVFLKDYDDKLKKGELTGKADTEDRKRAPKKDLTPKQSQILREAVNKLNLPEGRDPSFVTTPAETAVDWKGDIKHSTFVHAGHTRARIWIGERLFEDLLSRKEDPLRDGVFAHEAEHIKDKDFTDDHKDPERKKLVSDVAGQAIEKLELIEQGHYKTVYLVSIRSEEGVEIRRALNHYNGPRIVAMEEVKNYKRAKEGDPNGKYISRFCGIVEIEDIKWAPVAFLTEFVPGKTLTQLRKELSFEETLKLEKMLVEAYLGFYRDSGEKLVIGKPSPNEVVFYKDAGGWRCKIVDQGVLYDLEDPVVLGKVEQFLHAEMLADFHAGAHKDLKEQLGENEVLLMPIEVLLDAIIDVFGEEKGIKFLHEAAKEAKEAIFLKEEVRNELYDYWNTLLDSIRGYLIDKAGEIARNKPELRREALRILIGMRGETYNEAYIKYKMCATCASSDKVRDVLLRLDEMKNAYDERVKIAENSLASALERKDPAAIRQAQYAVYKARADYHDYQHSLEVANKALEYAKAERLSDEFTEALAIAALLHDVAVIKEGAADYAHHEDNSMKYAKEILAGLFGESPDTQKLIKNVQILINFTKFGGDYFDGNKAFEDLRSQPGLLKEEISELMDAGAFLGLADLVSAFDSNRRIGSLGTMWMEYYVNNNLNTEGLPWPSVVELFRDTPGFISLVSADEQRLSNFVTMFFVARLKNTDAAKAKTTNDAQLNKTIMALVADLIKVVHPSKADMDKGIQPRPLNEDELDLLNAAEEILAGGENTAITAESRELLGNVILLTRARNSQLAGTEIQNPDKIKELATDPMYESFARSVVNIELSPVYVRGVITSPGIAVGRLVPNSTIKTPEDFEGAILIDAATEPQDDPKIRKASGVLVTSGGDLSHELLRVRELEKAALVPKGVTYRNRKLTFKTSVAGQQVEETSIFGQKISIIRQSKTHQEFIVKEGDIVVVDAQEGKLYVIGDSKQLKEAVSLTQALIKEGGTNTLSSLKQILRETSDPAIPRVVLFNLIFGLPRNAKVAPHVTRELFDSALANANPAVKENVTRFLAGKIDTYQDKTNELIQAARKKIARGHYGHEINIAEMLYLVGEIKSRTSLVRGMSDAGIKFSMKLNEGEYSLLVAEAQGKLIAERERLRTEFKQMLAANALSLKDVSTVCRFFRAATRLGIDIREEFLAPSDKELADWVNQKLKERMEQLRELDHRPVLPKDGIDANYSPVIGGKGANAGEIYGLVKSGKLRARAPRGFNITTSAFKEWRKYGVTDEMRRKLLKYYWQLVSEQCEEFLGLVDADTQTPEPAKESIKSILRRFKEESNKAGLIEEEMETALETARKAITDFISPASEASALLKKTLVTFGMVAVRSSGEREDSLEKSFAGEWFTALGTVGPQEFIRAVQRVWESGAEAILVEEMINSQVSGVAFSIDSTTHDFGQIELNSTYGLGGVVSGKDDPDLYVIDKNTFKFKALPVIGTKKSKTVISETRNREGGFAKKEQVPKGEWKKESLTYEQAEEISKIVVAFEERFGNPVDVEWAVDPYGKVVVLQARPVTDIWHYVALGREALLGADVANEKLPDPEYHPEIRWALENKVNLRAKDVKGYRILERSSLGESLKGQENFKIGDVEFLIFDGEGTGRISAEEVIAHFGIDAASDIVFMLAKDFKIEPGAHKVETFEPEVLNRLISAIIENLAAPSPETLGVLDELRGQEGAQTAN